MKVYETRPGDTPLVIAMEQLGDCNRWREVVEFNAATHPHMGPHDWYRVGTILRLPEVTAMSAIDDMNLKFTSGNCIPVDRTVVSRDEWLAVVSEIEALRQERDGLRAQLPEGMKHCTILFRECEKGHGSLTATNWVQHCCPTCERDGLRELIIKTMNSYVKEMEGYSYFGSNPGIDDDDIEEIADEIIAAMAKEQGDES